MHSYHIMRPFPTTPQFDTVCSCRKNALKEIPHRQVLWSSSGSISTISTASAYDVSALSVSLHLDVTEKNVTSLVFANFLTKGEHWLTMHLHTCPLRIITTCSLLPCIAITHTPTHPPTHPSTCSHVHIHLTSLFQTQLLSSRTYLATAWDLQSLATAHRMRTTMCLSLMQLGEFKQVCPIQEQFMHTFSTLSQ